MIGRFASFSIRKDEELGVRSQVNGQHYEALELRLTFSDYLDHRVQEWIRRDLLPRLDPGAGFKIEVVETRWETKRDERTRPEHMAASGAGLEP